MASMSEELKLKFCLILTRFNLNNHLCLVAAILDRVAIEFLVKLYS